MTILELKPGENWSKYIVIVPFEASNGGGKSPFGNKMKWTWRTRLSAVGINPTADLQKFVQTSYLMKRPSYLIYSKIVIIYPYISNFILFLIAKWDVRACFCSRFVFVPRSRMEKRPCTNCSPVKRLCSGYLYLCLCLYLSPVP